MHSRQAKLALPLLAAAAVALLGTQAVAAPTTGLSTSGTAGTNGASATSKRQGPTSTGFELPERVYEHNAISALMPLQVGFINYMPKVRIGFQYDRQLFKQHWAYVGVAALFDRGDYRTFNESFCGLGSSSATCGKGTVAGFDAWAGYAYKFQLTDNPYLVPIARVGVGGGWWKYPKLSGTRLQALEKSWSLSVRGGGGVRLFLLEDLAIGLDLNLVLGFTRSTKRELAKETEKFSRFLLGMEILPLIVEYRF